MFRDPRDSVGSSPLLPGSAEVTSHFPVFRYFLRLIRQAETKNDDRESPCRRNTITNAAVSINSNDAPSPLPEMLWRGVLQTSHAFGGRVKVLERSRLRAIHHECTVNKQSFDRTGRNRHNWPQSRCRRRRSARQPGMPGTRTWRPPLHLWKFPVAGENHRAAHRSILWSCRARSRGQRHGLARGCRQARTPAGRHAPAGRPPANRSRCPANRRRRSACGRPPTSVPDGHR